jgi:dipeptidyl-peptidase-4
MTRWISVLALIACNAFGQGTKTDYERALSIGTRTKDTVFRAKVEPHWLPGGDAFWYRNDLAEGKREFVLVDAVKGERRVIPEPPAAEPPSRLPVERAPRPSSDGGEETRIVFVNPTEADANLFWIDRSGEKKAYGSVKANERREQHTYEGHVWVAEDATGAALGVWTARAESGEAVIETHAKFSEPDASGKPKPDWKQASWHPFIRDFNLWVRSQETGEEIPLSSDGTKDNAYGGPILLSPDETKLVALQTEPAQERKVYLVESSPKDQLQPKLLSYNYLKPGDRIAHDRPRLFDLTTKKPIPVKEYLFPNPWSISELRWSPDSARFTFLYNQRAHQVEKCAFSIAWGFTGL